MQINETNYSDFFDVEELNAYFVKNSKESKVVYDKLKKDNDSKRQMFITNMISKIITKRIDEILINNAIENRVEERKIYLQNEKEKLIIDAKVPVYNNIEYPNKEVEMKEPETEKPVPGSFICYN